MEALRLKPIWVVEWLPIQHTNELRIRMEKAIEQIKQTASIPVQMSDHRDPPTIDSLLRCLIRPHTGTDKHMFMI